MLAVLLAGQFMANVDIAIVNIAVPSVAAEFAAPPGQVALLAAGYLVAFAVLLVTGARLGATYGQRRVFLVGLLGFTVASLAAGLAQGLGWLLLARVAQGASAALLVPQVHVDGHHLAADGRELEVRLEMGSSEPIKMVVMPRRYERLEDAELGCTYVIGVRIVRMDEADRMRYLSFFNEGLENRAA